MVVTLVVPAPARGCALARGRAAGALRTTETAGTHRVPLRLSFWISMPRGARYGPAPGCHAQLRWKTPMAEEAFFTANGYQSSRR